MELVRLSEYVLLHYGDTILNATRDYFKLHKIELDNVRLDQIQCVAVSLFPKSNWFRSEKETAYVQTGPRIFNVAWCRLDFVRTVALPEGKRRYTDVMHVYLDGFVDFNLLALFNVATRMEPLFLDTITRCYNTIVFDDYPGLRPLLHVVQLKLYHEKFNPGAPTLLLSVQWPELVLMKQPQSTFHVKRYYRLNTFDETRCNVSLVDDSTLRSHEESLTFDIATSKNANLPAIEHVLKRVRHNNIVVPLFVYESIIYGDMLVNKKLQDDYELESIRENGYKLCDHSVQQFEFLPIAQLFRYFSVILPVRFESVEESEKKVLNYFET